MKKTILSIALCLMASFGFSQKWEGLAKTPPMGWNSWNTFALDINEQVVKDMADKFVNLGLKDAGYTYIVIDDGWMTKQRDENQNLVVDPQKFPNGLKEVSDYVHSKGLKFGIYNCAGSHTCGGFPGSRGHEYQDALLYARLGVDFLKYDWCSTGKLNAEEAYTTMRDALYATGRPILFSLCEWGDNQPWNWGAPIGHMWRISGDIFCCWDCEYVHDKGLPTQWSSWGVLPIIKMRQNIRQFNGPDHWNDPDMMEVGNGMSVEEDHSHFALWCLMASPLFLGNDLNKITDETLKTITNKELIAIDQDEKGIQGYEVEVRDSLSIWAKSLKDGNWAIGIFNLSKQTKQVSFDFKSLKFTDDVAKESFDCNTQEYKVRECVNHTDYKTGTKKPVNFTLKSHDCVVFKLEKSTGKK